MEAIKFRVIESETEIEKYIEKIESQTGVRLPPLYAHSSKIVGGFLQNKLVAGYMLVTKPSFRSLFFVPDSIKAAHSFFSNDQYEMMEVNGVWIGPAVKTPKMQFQFWMKLLTDIFMSKKKYLLLMSDARNKNIEHIHSLANPEILYEGSPNLMASDKSHATIRVGYTTRWRAVMNVPKYWFELKKREQRAKNFERKRNLERALGISVEQIQ